MTCISETRSLFLRSLRVWASHVDYLPNMGMSNLVLETGAQLPTCSVGTENEPELTDIDPIRATVNSVSLLVAKINMTPCIMCPSESAGHHQCRHILVGECRLLHYGVVIRKEMTVSAHYHWTIQFVYL